MTGANRDDRLPVPGGPDGGNDGAQGDELRDKAAEAFEYARGKADQLLDDVKLRKRVMDARAKRARTYAHAGRIAREALRDRDVQDGVLVSLVAEIDEAIEKIARIEVDEKAAAAEKPRTGFFDRLKQGAARAAGIAKHALERSLVERDLAQSAAGLAECLILHADRFGAVLHGCDEAIDALEAAQNADRELAALEVELAARGGEAGE